MYNVTRGLVNSTVMWQGGNVRDLGPEMKCKRLLSAQAV